MATIVTREQPSWQAKLAASILAPLVGNFINKAMERSENAYNNKRLQAALDATNPPQQPQNNLPGFTPQITPMTGNGWENAFRQNNNALADFDANTANLVNSLGITPQNQPAPKIPTMADNYAALVRNAGHANLATLQALQNPYIQAQEAARMEQRRKDAGAALAGVTGADRVNTLWDLYPQGLVPLDAVIAGQNQYQATWPESYNLNTGNSIIQGNRDKITGIYTPQITTKLSLTPEQSANIDFRNRQATEASREFDETMAYNRDRDAANRQDTQRPRLTQVITSGGKLYWTDQYGNTQPIMAGGKHLDAPQNAPANGKFEMHPVITAMIKSENDAIENAQKKRKELEDRRKNSFNPQEQQEIGTEIDKIDTDIKQRQERIQEYIKSSMQNGTPPQQPGQPQNTGNNDSTLPRLGVSDDIGTSMLSGANNGRISSAFGAARPNGRQHMGADYAVPRGKTILVPDVGTQLTVKSVTTNPTHSYGNHIVLEGNLKGHKIELLIAHMDNGSIKLQKGQKVNPGDLIGLVGNTGNTSDKSQGGKITTWYEGKNSGYHMHLETKLDGKHEDPATFFSKLAPYIVTEKPRTTNQPQTAPMSGDFTAQPENQGSNTSAAAFTHPTKEPISEAVFFSMLDRAEKGELSYAKNAAELIEKFKSQGYIPRKGFTGERNQNPNPINTSSDIPPVVLPGTVSTDIPATIPENQSGDITPPPASRDIPAQPQNARIQESEKDAEYRRRTGDYTPIIYANEEGSLTQKQFDDLWNKIEAGEFPELGIHTRDDFHAFLRAKGLRPVNNDATLANPLGNVGDNSHSPGPVHTNETARNTQNQIDYLNGKNNSNSDYNSSWLAFSGFGMPRSQYGIG